MDGRGAMAGGLQALAQRSNACSGCVLMRRTWLWAWRMQALSQVDACSTLNGLPLANNGPMNGWLLAACSRFLRQRSWILNSSARFIFVHRVRWF